MDEGSCLGQGKSQTRMGSQVRPRLGWIQQAEASGYKSNHKVVTTGGEGAGLLNSIVSWSFIFYSTEGNSLEEAAASKWKHQHSSKFRIRAPAWQRALGKGIRSIYSKA